MNVSIVGVGRYAKTVHIPYLRRSTHADLVGTIDPNPHINPADQNIPHCYDTENTQAFLNKHDVDGVIISTPPDQRHDVYDDLLGKPYHLHIDKPFLAQRPSQSLSSFLSEYQAYKELAESHALPITIHSQRRHDSYIQRCKQALQTTNQQTGVLPHYTYYRGVDGNFRTNNEWATDTYHGLSTDLGVLAHSFYHYIDTYAYLLQDICTIKTIDTSIHPTYLEDIHDQNNLCANYLLKHTDEGTAQGPIAITINYECKTQAGSQLRFTTRLSHLGMTKRPKTKEPNKITNQLTQNRFSQKHLEIQAGSLLSAQTTSQPIDPDGKGKQDTLFIHSRCASSEQRERQRRKRLDKKRRQCLASFIKTYQDGTKSKNAFSKHSLTHSLFYQACKALQISHTSRKRG